MSDNGGYGEMLLSVRNLAQNFKAHGGGIFRAVDNVSFDIGRGEAFGLVGESGSGKTTTGRAIMGIGKISGGKIIFGGEEIAAREGVTYTKAELRKMRDKRRGIQMVFQDPLSSLNPRMTVREIISEGLIINGVRDRERLSEKVYEIMDLVGLLRDCADRYPHEFSGGQRQRIGIARAVIMRPELIIADEPVSALDVSVQAQIINLLGDLKAELGLALMFIAHDLSVVKHFCDRIGVMYLGRMVELASSEELFENPLHPYTRALLSAIPLPNPKIERNKQRIIYNKEEFSSKYEKMQEISNGHFVLPF